MTLNENLNWEEVLLGLNMLSGQLITNKFGLGDDATDSGMFSL